MRLALCLLCVELVTHYSYANVMAKYKVWKLAQNTNVPFGPTQLAVISFWVLVFMWLKFLVIWRFTRFGALVDGIDPPENMKRCICNNYDIEGFWKNWHA